ncbi:MAG: hypothetical protein ACT4QD_05295 [Acidobacteriota bacterium]
MIRWIVGLLAFVALAIAPPLHAQSLFVLQGERAAEGSVAWAVGPFSHGVETHGAVSLDGRWDVGFRFNRYFLDFGGPDDGSLIEWAPFARYFLFKEADDSTPVSLAAFAEYVRDDFGEGDDGWYVLAGGQLFKAFTLTDALTLHPYVGFALAGESYSFGKGAERAVYLTRQFGVHGQLTVGPGAWVRMTVEEQSFRRETYRAVRVAYVRRF